ncbi:MAG: hypothetical protein MJ168_03290 [Clostridia bacterium]|nr:hypothetical protein [Clostridia bacterium]
MTLKKSSHNLSLAMFRQSALKVCAMPLLVFATAALYMIWQFVGIMGIGHSGNMYGGNTGFYFDEARSSDFLINVFFIAAAFISAAILFGFNWSKKQTNVIYSLGLSKKQIYLSRMLGGLLPMLAVILLITMLETFNMGWAGLTPNLHYWKMVLCTDLSWYSVYALSFVLCSVVFSATGNFIEGSVFSFIFALFPTVLNKFLYNCAYMYTLGNTNSINFTKSWSWDEPFFLNELTGFIGEYRDIISQSNDYFSKGTSSELGIFNFSSAITALVLAAVIFVIGFVAFKKHRNEIAGTWGRAKGVTEIAAAVVSLYAFSLLLNVLSYDAVRGNGGILIFVVCLVAFLISMIVFKLIFSSKRAKALKNSLKRFPIYAAGLGAVTLIFYCGMFGYSSYIPESSDVVYVDVSTAVKPYINDVISGTSYFGFKDMFFGNNILYDTYEQSVIYSDEKEIEEIIKLHKRIVDNGKIKDSADNACLYPITIRYKLSNGKYIERWYNESDEETAKLIMMLSNYKTNKDIFEKRINGTEKSAEETIVSRLKILLGKDVNVRGYGYADTNLNSLGFSIEWSVYEGEEYIGYVYADEENQLFFEDVDTHMLIGSLPDDWQNYEELNFIYMMNAKNCYLYSKDMTEGYALGMADIELFTAIKKDIVNQTAEQYFLHKPEDELGVITFGRSKTYYGNSSGYGYEFYDDEMKYEDEEETEVKPGTIIKGDSWNLNSNDNFAFVVTKDMTNTIKYLESKNCLKYLTAERKIDDIKSVKIATISELNCKNKNSSKIPVFFGAYWTSETVKAMTEELRGGDIYNYHPFEKIDNKISDKDKISKLLDNSVLFGFCPNNYRIVEIEYKDGSLATVLVSADAYNDIMS